MKKLNEVEGECHIEMNNEFKITSVETDTDNTIEMTVKTNMEDSDKTIIKGIEILIESIDGDSDKFEESMIRILYLIADRIGFNGWYDIVPDFNVQYDDKDEGYVTNKEKRLLLNQFLEQEKNKD